MGTDKDVSGQRVIPGICKIRRIRCQQTQRFLFLICAFDKFGRNYFQAYNGLGLDFSYSIAIAETLGEISCGAIPMALSGFP